jgi:hypothetical protein
MTAEAFLMPEPITARQRQTLSGRQALAEQFPSPEARTEHYRALGRRSAERRVVLSGDEAAALVGAYELLARIAERARPKTVPSPENAT